MDRLKDVPGWKFAIAIAIIMLVMTCWSLAVGDIGGVVLCGLGTLAWTFTSFLWKGLGI